MAAIITTTPRQAQTTCRTRKWYALPWSSWASTEDALHTITSPAPIRATVTVKSVVSEVSFLATSAFAGCQRPDLVLEGAAAGGVVGEHVEGRAAGGEEHGVPGRGALEPLLHGFLQRGAGDDGEG